MENKDTFTYSYSAKQQEEIKRIKQKYLPPEQNKLEQLRRLDKSAEKSGTAAAIAIGTVGALLLGIGMSLSLVWEQYMVLGIIIGIPGIVCIALALPVYKRIVQKQREKLAPQILQLTEELIQHP